VVWPVRVFEIVRMPEITIIKIFWSKAAFFFGREMKLINCQLIACVRCILDVIK
jgi:hypothetical protein